MRIGLQVDARRLALIESYISVLELVERGGFGQSVGFPTGNTTLTIYSWRLWAVLTFAVLSATLSFYAHYNLDKRIKIDDIAAVISANTKPASFNQPANWVIKLKSLLPGAVVFVPEAAQQLDEPLERLSQQLQSSSQPSAGDQIVLSTRVAWLAAQLRLAGHRADVNYAQATHYYYWALIGFVLALGSLLQKRRLLHQDQDMQRLLTDEVLFEQVSVGVCLHDSEGRVLRANEHFCAASGYSQEALLGRELGQDANDPAVWQDMWERLESERRWTGQFGLRSAEGSVVFEKVTRLAVGDFPKPSGGILTIFAESDVSDEEQRLMLWQAHHDTLTKLPNANLLHERLAHALTVSKQEQKQGGLISIDLDNFQQVNDSLGHALADRVLTESAYRIAMCARESDTVARMGSDLFVIVLDELEDLAQAGRIAQEAVNSIAKPFVVKDKELFITASAGIAIFPEDGSEQGDLLQKVDAARMSAKGQGGNQIRYFEVQMNAAAERRLEIETQLRKAIERDELELYYQPVMDGTTEAIVGAEALLRWHSETLGMVSPGEFIPVAEDTGLIVEIGAWVIDTVQRQQELWQAQGICLRVALNVSAKQFRTPEDAQSLLSAFGEHAATRLAIEVTESALIDDHPGASEFLTGLRGRGIPVSLDDFGTGFSSIGYLRDFEFDVLKIDRSFINNLGDTREYGLVASIISMGNLLGMRVVAEGVEEFDQLRQLRQIGVHLVQGFYYSKPLPVAEFVSFVAEYANVLSHKVDKASSV